MQQPRSSGSSGAAGGIARRGEPRPEAAVKSYYYVWACERRRHSADDSRRRPFFSPFLSCVSCAEPLTGRRRSLAHVYSAGRDESIYADDSSQCTHRHLPHTARMLRPADDLLTLYTVIVRKDLVNQPQFGYSIGYCIIGRTVFFQRTTRW